MRFLLLVPLASIAWLCACRSVAPNMAVAQAVEKSAIPASVPGSIVLRVIDADLAVTTWSTDSLANLGVVDVEWNHRDETHHYGGVPLNRLYKSLAAKARTPGAHKPGSSRRDGGCVVVLASASDGYRAVFSAAELTDDFGPTDAYVVWEESGHALPSDEAPLRLVVTTDQGGARGIRRLEELRIVNLDLLVPRTSTLQPAR